MDLYSIVNNGELTPKQVAVAETVHHLSRLKHMITLLDLASESITNDW